MHYYFNFPSLVILLSVLVLLIRIPSRASKLDRDDVRQKAKRRL